MNLPELSIKRYTFATMLNLLIVLFGIIGFNKIGSDRVPKVELPTISIFTQYKGGSPSIIDSSLTNYIESAVNSISGIENIRSSSTPGVSLIVINFVLEKKIDFAFNEVQEKINQIVNKLPPEVDTPVIRKVETNTNSIVWLSLEGDRTQKQLNQYASNIIIKKLENIDGVAQARLGGRRDRNIRINLDHQKMLSNNITALEIFAAFKKEHIQMPGGFLTSDSTEFLINLDLEFKSVDDLSNMIIHNKNNFPVRLRNISSVEDGLEEFRQIARRDGKTSIGIGISKIQNQNTLKVIQAVKEKIKDEVIPFLPPGMDLKVVSDDSIFIKDMINTLKEHLLEGTVLAGFIVFLFLRNIRATMIIVTSIPVSLLGAVAAMYFFDFTFNSITLLGLLLLIGIVVDDSIVILESIYKKMQIGNLDSKISAIEGSNDVVFAVLASTLALVSIFVPVIFLSGILGKFLNSFAVVVTVGILISWFVSLTLTPMLCSRYLVLNNKPSKKNPKSFFLKVESFYKKILKVALLNKKTVIFLAVAFFISSFWFLGALGKAFLPDTDESKFFVFFETPLGSNIYYTEKKLKKIEEIISKYKEVDNQFSIIGLGSAGQVNKGRVIVRLKPANSRKLSQKEIMSLLKDEINKIPGIKSSISNPSIVGGGRGEKLQFSLTADNFDEIKKITPIILNKLQSNSSLVNITNDLQISLPQLVLLPNRVKASELGISVKDISQTLNIMTGGSQVATFYDKNGDGQRHPILIKGIESEYDQNEILKKIYLRSKDNRMIRLDSIAKWEEIINPGKISKYDLRYSTNFLGNPNVSLGESINIVENIANKILPSGQKLEFTGQAKELKKTIQNISFTFFLALILLFMVLSSQFNSFLQPIYIMVSLPLAIIGAGMGLWIFGHTLNIYSMIGIVLLIGLVAKNSILLVDITNKKRGSFKNIDDALMVACPTRLRPVLMTSLTLILALTPAALGIGSGSETNGPLAVAVIGGMITSTILTLIVVPVTYSLIENLIRN